MSLNVKNHFYIFNICSDLIEKLFFHEQTFAQYMLYWDLWIWLSVHRIMLSFLQLWQGGQNVCFALLCKIYSLYNCKIMLESQYYKAL
jgi:hypothetical protein